MGRKERTNQKGNIPMARRAPFSMKKAVGQKRKSISSDGRKNSPGISEASGKERNKLGGERTARVLLNRNQRNKEKGEGGGGQQQKSHGRKKLKKKKTRIGKSKRGGKVTKWTQS